MQDCWALACSLKLFLPLPLASDQILDRFFDITWRLHCHCRWILRKHRVPTQLGATPCRRGRAVQKSWDFRSPIAGVLRGNWFGSCCPVLFCFHNLTNDAVGAPASSLPGLAQNSWVPPCGGRDGPSRIMRFLRMIVQIDLRLHFPVVQYPGKFCF